MPLIKVETSVECDKETQVALTKELSLAVSKCTGKPEMYVAAVVETGAVITFGGDVVDGAFVDVRGIGGFNRTVNNALTVEICTILNKFLSILTTHIYINFTDVAAVNWGHDNKTFG